jgi:hypothetical protein
VLFKFRYVLLALIAVLVFGLSVSLVACGDDDDEDGVSTWYISFDTSEVMAAPKDGDYGEVRCVRN